jgi:hypothetical protein
MAKVISTLSDAITYINSLYDLDATAPTAGDEDYTVWTSLVNAAINLWETEEGVLWDELFITLASAADGDKSTDGTTEYTLPTLFAFPASAYVWVGTGTSKTPYKVIDVSEVQLLANNVEKWCYFVKGFLEFNPNLTMSTGNTISYNFYKFATKVSAGADVIEMSDPMFTVYYAVGELKKEEGDTSALQTASQKMESMKTKNTMPAWFQSDNNLEDSTDEGLG